MAVLTNIKPEKVFQYFEEMCAIPHGSGNVEQISDYLKAFADERGLEVIQDEIKNIIIIKEASKGYENEPAVIIQGHMDMVAVSKPELNIDMTKDPLKVAVDGDKVYAEGTSLGGDDGIAVAYALALLDDASIQHPRLEVVITVDEETGMDGAREIDLSMLKGNRLLNLDSDVEGVFLTSCAGGAGVLCEMEFEPDLLDGQIYDVVIGGLQGGHSGVEIHKERGNSNLLMARLLWDLRDAKMGLVSCQGGLADNAIPRETKAKILVSEENKELFEEVCKKFEKEVAAELATKDPDFFVSVKAGAKGRVVCVAGESLKRTAAMLLSLPNGIQAMSADMPGLVETSLNLGVLKINTEKMQAMYAVRSSIESSKEALLNKMEAIIYLAGGKYTCTGSYPGWAYRVDSPLREKMIILYEEMYGSKPQVEAIHAGLECGLLASKIHDLDCVSFGPNMYNIHTTEEYISISSVQRVWEYLVRLLAMRG